MANLHDIQIFVKVVQFESIRRTAAPWECRSRRTFPSASEPDARRIAGLLGVRYRQLADGSFEHSQGITLTDSEGRVLTSTATMIGDSAFQAKLRAATAAAAQ